MDHIFAIQAPDPRDFSRSLQQTQEVPGLPNGGVEGGHGVTSWRGQQLTGDWLEFCEASLNATFAGDQTPR